MHIGLVQDDLDLTQPAIALSVSRALHKLNAHISKVRTAAHEASHIVLAEMEQPFLSWRLDTCSIVESEHTIDEVHDRVIGWINGQGCISSERCVSVHTVLSSLNY